MANTNKMTTVPALTISMLVLLLLLAIVPLVLAESYPTINLTGGFSYPTRNDNSNDRLVDVACVFAGEAIHRVLRNTYPIKTCNKEHVTRSGVNQAAVKLSIKKNGALGAYDCTVHFNYHHNTVTGIYTYYENNVHCKH